MTAQRVLIIEDDPQIGRLVAMELREASYEVDVIDDGKAGLRRFEREDFDLVVLDLMLPGLDGLEICRRIRENNRYTPIVMLTARAAKLDIVRGLEIGADEYVTKPFATAELMARIHALFRRMAADRERAHDGAGAEPITHGVLSVDAGRHEVRIDGRVVGLTAKEFDLLYLFARYPGRTFSRSDLLNEVWGVEFEGYEHTVNTHINRLRNKIEPNSSEPRYIETVWGVGYRFAEQSVDGVA